MIDTSIDLDNIPCLVHYDSTEHIWVLDSLQTLKLQICKNCHKQLPDLGWFLCQEKKIAFCRNCELNSHLISSNKKQLTGRMCMSLETTHTHYPINACRKEIK